MNSDLVDRLLERAFLYDDPQAFRAGVETTMRELAHLLPPIEPPAPPAEGAESERAAG